MDYDLGFGFQVKGKIRVCSVSSMDLEMVRGVTVQFVPSMAVESKQRKTMVVKGKQKIKANQGSWERIWVLYTYIYTEKEEEKEEKVLEIYKTGPFPFL